MLNILEIIKNNNKTFRRTDRNETINQRPRIIIICLFGISSAFFFYKIPDSFLAGFVAFQSILLGFTFNVMFFLVSKQKEEKTSDLSIEAEIRATLLSTLYHELFYNISYFNLIALFSIVISLVLLLPQPSFPEYFVGLYMRHKLLYELISLKPVLETFSAIHFIFLMVRLIATAIFYSISIEIVFSIFRVISRTSFYFEKKIDAVNKTK